MEILKPSLLLYYYPRKENETFLEAQAKARRFAKSDKFSLILFVTREANHPGGDFIDEIGHYFYGMRMRATKRKISTRVWYAPRDLVAHLCEPSYDFKALIEATGRSPIVLTDIFPKCLLDKEKSKHDIRIAQTRSELENHFKKIFFYEELWQRIKLVVFSLEPSITDGREERYREARELFQTSIQKRYGKKEFLSVPFFGMGIHRFMNIEYWGAWDEQMRVLGDGIAKFYPGHKKLVSSIVGDYKSKANSSNE